jgi:Subunit ChlI of Mg-chelatase
MLFKTFSAAVFGIDAYLVEIEVDVVPAFQGYFTVVGLPDIAVKESRERIRAALRNLALVKSRLVIMGCCSLTNCPNSNAMCWR